MNSSRQNGEDSKGLVEMFTAERRREQDEVMPLRTIYLDAVEGGRVTEVFVIEGRRST